MTRIPRILLAAPSSGSGKTLITCGLLSLLKRRGLAVTSFKCGPDFIDPMFHTRVIGAKSRNLDTFFTGEVMTRSLLVKNAAGSDIAVMEGVMGYFDGIGIDGSRAGASDLAAVTDTPVVLVVPAKGASRSILPLIKGFLDFEERKMIRGIVLNRISPMLYPRMKEMIEENLHIPVVGYVPVLEDCLLESRHLGLMLPDEIESLQDKLTVLADRLEESLDIDAILGLAAEVPDLEEEPPCQERMPAEGDFLRVGLARDEAFCFFYEDNLQMMRELGVELVPFSPVHDRTLPEDLDGLWLHGGYPELYVEELSSNVSMRSQIREKIEAGLPTLAECGGFLYLHDEMRGMDGTDYAMVGALAGHAHYTGRLTRFGYISLTGGRVFGREVGEIRSHEFHYYDSDNNGEAFLAEKPTGKRSWRCLHSSETLLAGFPHLYFYANPKIARSFVEACIRGRRGRET